MMVRIKRTLKLHSASIQPQQMLQPIKNGNVLFCFSDWLKRYGLASAEVELTPS